MGRIIINRIALFFTVVLFGLLVPFVACDLGQEPVGTTEVDPVEKKDSLLIGIEGESVDTITPNMRIFVDPPALRATNTDKALVTVVLVDSNRNPMKGYYVEFSASHGIITKSDSTNSIGIARAMYTGVPINAEARIVAVAQVEDSTIAVRTNVTLLGVVVLVSPGYSDALVNTKVPVTVTVLDGAGLPVADAAVTLAGADDSVGVTKGDGTFSTTAAKSDSGEYMVSAFSLGATDTTKVRFWRILPTEVRDTVRAIRQLRLFSSRSQLKANNSDKATITAILTNEKNNPLPGDTILFSSDLGVIDGFGVVDENGRASVELTSSPVNGECRVTAEVAREDANLRDSIVVLFSGISIEITPRNTDLSVDDSTEIEALLKDGSGNAIGGDPVEFRIVSSIGSFTDGSKTIVRKADPNGKASVFITSGSAGEVRILASGLNTEGTTSVRFATNFLTLTQSGAIITVGGNDSCQITAIYKDSSKSPVPNVYISFATNAGSVADDSVMTDSQGKAQTWLRSASFSGTATVEARAMDQKGGSASLEVQFTADRPARVLLEITPDNIGVNGGIATLRATVQDSNGNMVSGMHVNFRLLRGPGGGEHVDQPVVVTNNGVARSQLFAGTQPSQYRATEVVATVTGISDTSKLTISGEPYTVTISRPEDDSAAEDAGELDRSVFNYFVGAVVQDINGNPVADGTRVQFSALVTGMLVAKRIFSHWNGIDDIDEAITPVYVMVGVDVPFEDVNNNFRMDPNIDLRLDFNDGVASRGDDVNGDGVMEYDPSVHDFFWDYNNNGRCDTTAALGGEPWTYSRDSLTIIFADINRNGRLDTTEWVDYNGNGINDLGKLSDSIFTKARTFDFRYTLWEMRPQFRKLRFDFDNNEFAVAIEASVPTKKGVAQTKITYPRQMANRFYATVNAEVNGVRDKDGERFVLAKIKKDK